MARQSTGNGVPVLLTRPKAQSQAFAKALVARFGARVRPVVTPLMAPVHLTPALPAGPFHAVIFTSATGVAAAKGLSLPRRAYCVGDQTAARAQAAGFQALSAGGDAEALVALITAEAPAGRLLHLRGAETRGDVAERLISAGIETVSVVVYRQDPQPLTPEALALLAEPGPVILPLFSPRSALLFRAAMPPDLRAGLRLAALSPAVADAASGLAQAAPALARRLDAEAMLDAVGQLLESCPAP